MKTAIYLLLFVLIMPSVLYAQEIPARGGIMVQYEDVQIGRAVNVGGMFPVWKRGSIQLGIKIHHNLPGFNFQGFVFKKRFFATSFREQLGLALAYRSFYNLNGNRNQLYWGIQNQISRMPVRRSGGRETGPILAVDFAPIVGIKANIWDQLSFFFQGGIGAIFYHSENPFDRGNEFSSNWGFGLMYSFQ